MDTSPSGDYSLVVPVSVQLDILPMNVLIDHLPTDATEAGVREILAEHGVPVTSVRLSNEGNPDHLVAVVALDTDEAGARALAGMVDGRLWKGRRLSARALTLFTGED